MIDMVKELENLGLEFVGVVRLTDEAVAATELTQLGLLDPLGHAGLKQHGNLWLLPAADLLKSGPRQVGGREPGNHRVDRVLFDCFQSFFEGRGMDYLDLGRHQSPNEMKENAAAIENE